MEFNQILTKKDKDYINKRFFNRYKKYRVMSFVQNLYMTFFLIYTLYSMYSCFFYSKKLLTIFLSSITAIPVSFLYNHYKTNKLYKCCSHIEKLSQALDIPDEYNITVTEENITVNDLSVSWKDIVNIMIDKQYIILATNKNLSIFLKIDENSKDFFANYSNEHNIPFSVMMKKSELTPEQKVTLKKSIKETSKRQSLQMLKISVVSMALTAVFTILVESPIDKVFVPSGEPFEKMFATFKDTNEPLDIYDVYLNHIHENYNAALKTTRMADGRSEAEFFLFEDSNKIISYKITDNPNEEKSYVTYSNWDLKSFENEIMGIEYINNSYPKIASYHTSYMQPEIEFGLKDKNIFTNDDKAVYNFKVRSISFNEITDNGENRFTVRFGKCDVDIHESVSRLFNNLSIECSKSYDTQNIDIEVIAADISRYCLHW